MLVLLAVACIAYRTYVVSREPHDLPPSPVEAEQCCFGVWALSEFAGHIEQVPAEDPVR